MPCVLATSVTLAHRDRAANGGARIGSTAADAVRDPGAMRLVEVDGDDEDRLQALTALFETIRLHDDPDGFAVVIEDVRGMVRYGSELEPYRFELLEDDAGTAVGVLQHDAPVHDNLHLIIAEIGVHPDHRRRGHGTCLVEAYLDRARAQDRTILWLGTADDDAGPAAFLERHGFARAGQDVRRRQVLAEVDPTLVDRLEAEAAEHARDYRFERLDPPYGDALLAELARVTAAINDAPMGGLTFEDEVFDLERMRNIERAHVLRGERLHRVLARHRDDGELAGHTVVVVPPWDPVRGEQGDTAVAREHRGHRLGLALKIEMMRWLAEAEPQLEVIETWNNVDNTLMIRVNEALGYRLSREFAMFERKLRAAAR